MGLRRGPISHCHQPNQRCARSTQFTERGSEVRSKSGPAEARAVKEPGVGDLSSRPEPRCAARCSLHSIKLREDAAPPSEVKVCQVQTHAAQQAPYTGYLITTSTAHGLSYDAAVTSKSVASLLAFARVWQRYARHDLLRPHGGQPRSRRLGRIDKPAA